MYLLVFEDELCRLGLYESVQQGLKAGLELVFQRGLPLGAADRETLAAVERQVLWQVRQDLVHLIWRM